MRLTPTRVRAGALCAVLAAAAFAQEPGRIVPDTKLDLTVDPGGFMLRALHLWDPQAAFGGLQNQAYGYLFPMGPFFAVAHLAHVPAWVAQRLWWTVLLSVAFLGMLRLARRLGVGTPSARMLGALAYALAPRALSELGGISAELLPMALLPWTVLPLVAVEQGRASPRRGAALSGVAVLLMGGVNAAATLAALVVPALYLLTRPRTTLIRERLRLAGWWVLSVLLACAWWVGPLLLLGRYSYRFVDAIESAANTTAHTSLLEALRGTSHWLGYVLVNGRPPWPAAWYLTTYPGAVLQTAMLAGLGIAGLALRRMPERRFAVWCLLVGLVLVTAGHVGPLDGGLAAGTRSALDGALAPLRNVHKADPVLRFAMALGLAHSVAVLGRRLATARAPALQQLARHGAAVVVALSAVLLAGTAVPALAGRVSPPGAYTAIPVAWQQAADWLQAHSDGNRTMVLPAATFAEFTWGTTKDEPLQALAGDGVTWAVRDAVPLGSAGSTRLMDAWSSIVDTGRGSPGLAPSLARAGVRYLVVRDGLDVTATGAPSPWRVRAALTASPGLSLVATFGHRVAPGAAGVTTEPAVGAVPVEPESALAAGDLPEVEIWRVGGDVARASALPLAGDRGVAVLSGGPEALPDLLGSGLLAGRAVVLAGDIGALPDVAGGSGWMLTDTLRHRLNGYGDVRRNVGPTAPATDPLAARRVPDFLPDTGVQHQTTAVLAGAASVTASSTAADPGEPSRYDLAARPVSAFDSDPATAWLSGPLRADRTEWVQETWTAPVGPGTVTITVGTAAELDAQVQHLTVQTDAGAVGVDIPPGVATVSAEVPGATRRLRVLVDRLRATGADPRASLVDVTSTGTGPVTDALVPPRDAPEDLLSTGPSAIVLARSGTSRAGCVEAARNLVCIPGTGSTGEEARGLDRELALGRTSAWSASGRAVTVPGSALDRLVYGSAPVQATSSSRLSPEPADAPGAAVDGSTLTSWTAATSDANPVLTLSWAVPVTVASARLLAGGGGPSAGPVDVTVEVAGRSYPRTVAADGSVSWPSVRTNQVVLRFTDWPGRRAPTSGNSSPMSVGEVSVPGVTPTADRTTDPVDLPCGSGPALAFDGVTMPTRAEGTVAGLLRTGTLTWTACADLTLPAGSAHIFADGSGPLAVDSLVALPAGAASPPTSAGHSGAARTVTVAGWTDGERTLRVGAGDAAVLTVAENANQGWTATLHGVRLVAVRVDGWAQGWVVPAGAGGTVTLNFDPERSYRLTLAAGLVLAIALVVLALTGRRTPVPLGARAPVGPSRRTVPTPAVRLVGSIGGAAAGFLLCGWVGAVVLGAALVPAWHGSWLRRSWLLPAVAATALTVAGLLAALAPWPSEHAAGDGSATQLLALLALAAVVAAGGPAVSRPLGRSLDQPPADSGQHQGEDEGQPEDRPEPSGERDGPGDPQDGLDDEKVQQEH